MPTNPKSILRHLELRRDTVEDWSAYPFNIPAVASLQTLEFNAKVTCFIGENGAGKSTLIEAIAILAGFNAEGGTKNFQAANRPSESPLHKHLRLARGSRRERGGFFLRAETMFNVSTEAEAYTAYHWENLHEMSHGEAFLWIALNKFQEGGLFILDEPEAALSPQRQLALLARMHHYTLTRAFLQNPQAMLQRLFADVDALLQAMTPSVIRPCFSFSTL